MASLCQGPVDVSVQASLTRRNGIINTVKKGKLGSPDFTMLPRSTIKRDRLKYEWYCQPIRHSTAQNVMNLSK